MSEVLSGKYRTPMFTFTLPVYMRLPVSVCVQCVFLSRCGESMSLCLCVQVLASDCSGWQQLAASRSIPLPDLRQGNRSTVSCPAALLIDSILACRKIFLLLIHCKSSEVVAKFSFIQSFSVCNLLSLSAHCSSILLSLQSQSLSIYRCFHLLVVLANVFFHDIM